MVVHVPVEESKEGIQYDRSTVESEVRHIVRQSYVLGVVAKEKKPAPIEWRKCDQDRDHPELKVDREDQD
jgi:hypothetical protein